MVGFSVDATISGTALAQSSRYQLVQTYEDIGLPDQDSEREIDRDDGVAIYEGAARIGEVRGQGKLLKHQTAILLSDFILVTMSHLSPLTPTSQETAATLEVFVG